MADWFDENTEAVPRATGRDPLVPFTPAAADSTRAGLQGIDLPESDGGGMIAAMATRPAKLLRGAADASELIGGILGGMAGEGLASIPLATRGAMLGRSLGDLLLAASGTERHDPREQLNRIGTAGVNAGLSETGGLAFGAGVRGLGRGVNRYLAVKPSNKLLAEFPDVMKTINEGRFPIGSAANPATEAAAARASSGKALQEALDRATQAGHTHTLDPTRLPKSLRRMADKLGKGKDSEETLATIRKSWADAVNNAKAPGVGGRTVTVKARSVEAPIGTNAGGKVTRAEAVRLAEHHEAGVARGRKSSAPLAKAWRDAIAKADKAMTERASDAGKAKVSVTPKQLHPLKQSHQEAGFAAVPKKGSAVEPLVPANTKLAGRVDKEISRAMRSELHGLPEEFGIGPRDLRTQSLIGAERAIRESEMRGGAKFPHMFGAPGALLNAVLEPATQPRYMSAVARGLMHPATMAATRQVPRAASAFGDTTPLELLQGLIDQ